MPKKFLLTILFLAQLLIPARAVLQNTQEILNGGTPGNGLSVDLSNATNGFLIFNGQKSSTTSGKFGGGLLLYDSTNDIFKSIINSNGTLKILDVSTGTEASILTSSTVFTQVLSGFSAGSGTQTVTATDTLMQAIQKLAGNSVQNRTDIDANTNAISNITSGNTSLTGAVLISPVVNTSFTVNGNSFFDGKLSYVPSSTVNISAASGLTVTKGIMRVQGNGGAVDITANPQIAAGSDGQIVIIKGQSDTNTVKFDHGSGLSLQSSLSFVLGYKDTLTLMYDAVDAEWIEISRTNR
jgi:hypothetical protein